jgi:hypothetical protein
MTWQPIDTVPEDGTEFDAWCVDPQNHSHGARFSSVKMRGDRSGFGVIMHYKDGVAWEYLERNEGIFPIWQITHWMHPPEPPK